MADATDTRTKKDNCKRSQLGIHFPEEKGLRD